jgi:hypothetical protein
MDVSVAVGVGSRVGDDAAVGGSATVPHPRKSDDTTATMTSPIITTTPIQSATGLRRRGWFFSGPATASGEGRGERWE